MLIKEDMPTFPKMLKQAGYATGVVGKWHLGLGNGNVNWNESITPSPNQIGFDYSYIMAATNDRVPTVYVKNGRVVNLDPNDPIAVSYKTPFPGEPLAKDHPEMLTVMKASPNHGHNQAIVNGIGRIGYMKGGKKALWKDENIADSITEHAVKFIQENKDHPFFLYFGTNDAHVPRVPHPRFRGKSRMGPRGDVLLQFDWSVGEISRTLEEQGLTENTIVIVTSDNPRTEEPQAIIDDILAGMRDTDTPYVAIPDRVEAIHYAMDHAQSGDVIILAGKGHEDYQEINHVHYPMDERVIVADYLKKQG